MTHVLGGSCLSSQFTALMNLRPRRRPVPAIPIVSLIDIMVILLIFFIATTSFNEEKKQVKITLPQSKALGEAVPKQEVRRTLAITQNQELILDGTPVDAEHLAAAIQQLRDLNPGVKLELQADAKTELELLIKVWDALREAGYPINDVPARIKASGK
ncbi:biopolymer transport protein ExbD [Prosthecobacter debontii]|uniref:Biopolymer transport protein ExbD n=2 Tax=Prosthecobacter debontii TaxID=48467 RepID=A0A1T4YU86_9BACT|nr:biopolymer transport protein ExbD [Prosthecobacter debontii]